MKVKRRRRPNNGEDLGATIRTGEFIPCEGVLVNEDGTLAKILVADEDIGDVLVENRRRNRPRKNTARKRPSKKKKSSNRKKKTTRKKKANTRKRR